MVHNSADAEEEALNRIADLQEQLDETKEHLFAQIRITKKYWDALDWIKQIAAAHGNQAIHDRASATLKG